MVRAPVLVRFHTVAVQQLVSLVQVHLGWPLSERFA